MDMTLTDNDCGLQVIGPHPNDDLRRLRQQLRHLFHEARRVHVLRLPCFLVLSGDPDNCTTSVTGPAYILYVLLPANGREYVYCPFTEATASLAGNRRYNRLAAASFN